MRSKNVIERRITSYGLALLLLSQGCSSTPPEPIAENEAPPAASEAGPTSNRRVFEGCDPAEKARSYESWVGESVLISFAWTKKMKEGAADLKAPAKLIRIDPPYVIVGFDPRVRNLDLYVSVWTYSGHVVGRSDGVFGIAPCSATFERGSW
jgi:hypothetical protein